MIILVKLVLLVTLISFVWGIIEVNLKYLLLGLIGLTVFFGLLFSDPHTEGEYDNENIEVPPTAQKVVVKEEPLDFSTIPSLKESIKTCLNVKLYVANKASSGYLTVKDGEEIKLEINKCLTQKLITEANSL